MADLEHRKHKVDLKRFTVLAPNSPFVDVILQSCLISPGEYDKIANLAASYPNDPRLIEMVRRAGDASAKVPYLLKSGETPHSILETLRAVAEPYVDGLRKLPEPMQATIHTLLSINLVPRGYEAYGIPALLEINRIQKEMTTTLHGMMTGRKLALEFREENEQVLKLLDQEWYKIRFSHVSWPLAQSLPESSQMQFIPKYIDDRLVDLREICVVVESPGARELRSLTPRVLQNPLPEDEMIPVTGSADWLLRVIGKIGRHFTRALLDIIVQHLEEERSHPCPQDIDRINYEAQDALRSFNERHA